MSWPNLSSPDIQYVPGLRGPLMIYNKAHMTQHGNEAFNTGIAACIEQLTEMHKSSANWHNHYQNAADELLKLKTIQSYELSGT